MNTEPLRIVFMGCPDFAIPSLKILSEDPEFKIVAVYCMPDRPKGRGKKPSPTPVKTFATEHDYVVQTPATFRNAPAEIEALKAFSPDYIVVVAYGLILPQAILDIPRIAAINLHASILPEFRGPSPIHQAILAGKSKTGNTVMLMSKGMDEGDILSVAETPINDSDDFAALHDRLSTSGAILLAQTLKDYATGNIQATPQQHDKATYTSKITPQTARINWNMPATVVNNLIRAMSPFPGAWFEDDNERIKVFKALTVVDPHQDLPPGSVLSQDLNEGICVECGQSTVIKLLELQRAGKSRLVCADFLRGCKLKSAHLTSETNHNV